MKILNVKDALLYAALPASVGFILLITAAIPSNYNNEFIEYCYKNIYNYDVTCEKLNVSNDDVIDYKKLAINDLIGNFKPNNNKRPNWSCCVLLIIVMKRLQIIYQK